MRMRAQVREKIERMVVKKIGEEDRAHGEPEAQLARLREWAGTETSHSLVAGMLPSARARTSLTRLQAEVFQLCAMSNPMHPDVFPSVICTLYAQGVKKA